MTMTPLRIPPGLSSDDTTYAAAGRWADCSLVRWWQDLPQTYGGWERLMGEMLSGVCRAAFSWTDRQSILNIAFGTHSHLQAWRGSLYDITPTLGMPAAKLGSDPLAVTNGSAVVTVTHKGHGLTTADTINLAGAAALGGITPNGGPFTVTVLDQDHYTFAFTSDASSTAAAGGGSAVIVTPQVAFAVGMIDGTGGAGFSTGAYGVGAYSEPSTADYFPRTWSLAAWGENLMACPRGGAIHGWANDTSVRAAPLANAPRNVTFMLVTSQDQVMALGCNEEVSGLFNPLCIRHSSVRNNTVWNTAANTTAREYVLPGGGRIVGGRVLGPYILVWTNHSLFLGTFVGALNQPWRFDRIGEKCGLIGPNAAVVVGQAAYWIGPDLQFYRYVLGGAAEPIPCPIRNDFVENLTPSQADKIVASSISKFSEIRFDYPDKRDGTENSRFVGLSLARQGWHRGRMSRSAFLDAGPTLDPVGVSPSGAAYWHERGASADGGALDWFAETADQYLSEEQTGFVRGIWPDMKGQVGPVNVSVVSRFKPQGDETTKGPFPMAVGEDKVDLRCTGRMFRLRFEGSSAPSFARLGQITVDFVGAGRR